MRLHRRSGKSRSLQSETDSRPSSVKDGSGGRVEERPVPGPLDSDKALMEMGYKSELKREFTMFSAFSFAVSISGLFATIGTTFYYPLSSGGSASAVWAWLISGAGCMCIAASVAQLVSAYPTSGGLYYACSKVFPKKWAPAMCWVDGWLNLLGQVAGIASSDWGAAAMLLQAVSMGSNFTYVPTTNHVVGVMAAILVFHGFVNSFPTKWLERLTSTYVVFHFGCLIAGAIALLAVAHPKHDATYVFTHVESSTGWTPVGFSFLFGFLSVSWTMTDYDATAHICEEMEEPERKAPWAIFVAMAFTYVLGFMYNIVLCFCMGDPALILNQTQPVAMIYYNVLGKGAGIFFTVAMFLVMNMVGITAIQSCSRTMWAQSRDGMIPYFGRKWFVKVSSLTDTPLITVWVTVGFSIAINLIGLASSTAINAIFNVCAIALDWSYVVPILGANVFSEFKPGPWHMGKFSPFVTWWAIAWTTFVSVIFFMPTNLPVTPQNMNYAVVFFVGIIGFAIAFWYLGGNKVFSGPQTLVDIDQNPPLSLDADIASFEEEPKKKHSPTS